LGGIIVLALAIGLVDFGLTALFNGLAKAIPASWKTF
jgi:hypothetical protein